MVQSRRNNTIRKGTPNKISLYQKSIHDIDPSINPAGVEASMRLQYSTLDHLTHETFVKSLETPPPPTAE